VKISVALRRLGFQLERHPKLPAKPFDDGLVEIARLLTNEEPNHHSQDRRGDDKDWAPLVGNAPSDFVTSIARTVHPGEAGPWNTGKDRMSPQQFRQLAAYNRWANARLYAAAIDLPDKAYRLHIGVFFGSLHGTLNHLLLTDRLWLKRLTGVGDHPNQLGTILYDDRSELTRARIAEDARLVSVVEQYDETALCNLHSYKTTSGMPNSQVLADILLHLFNHQTHHRGQAHACLSILTGEDPSPLDLLIFQRGGPAPDLEALLKPNRET
jgi:uncharacterized damage-inducible protein DinB